MPSQDSEGKTTLFEDDAARSGYVRTMFGEISGRYDLMNTVITGGRHSAWRRATARALVRPGDTVLDVGCGTGDLAFDCAARGAGSRAGRGLRRADAGASRAARRERGRLPPSPSPPPTRRGCRSPTRASTSGAPPSCCATSPTSTPHSPRRGACCAPAAGSACSRSRGSSAAGCGRSRASTSSASCRYWGARSRGTPRPTATCPTPSTTSPQPRSYPGASRAAGFEGASIRRFGLGTVALHVATRRGGS